MHSQRPKIIIWCGRVLSRSETFVVGQSSSLERFMPHFAGCQSADPESLIPANDCFLANRGAAGKVRETIFKLTGVAPRLKRQIEKLRPALIHAHHGVSGALALPLARSLRIPLVVTFHGADATTRATRSRFTSVAGWALHRREQWLKDGPALIIAVSQFIKRKLLAAGYPDDKVVVHHIGVNTDKFRADPAVVREPVVLFVGRLVEKKGTEYLLRAMDQVQMTLPNVQLVIAGDGPLRASLQPLAARLRRCTFLGMQSHDVVKGWMNRASMLVAPSVTAASGDSEGLPTVIVEAQAMGLPVVATDHAGNTEAVTDGRTGLIAAERDVETLAKHIVRLSTDTVLWARLSHDARLQTEREFDIRRQTRVLEGLYEEALARSAAPQALCRTRPEPARFSDSSDGRVAPWAVG
jgi:glycosyltransferase involved in cell wall biosynthesis